MRSVQRNFCTTSAESTKQYFLFLSTSWQKITISQSAKKNLLSSYISRSTKTDHLLHSLARHRPSSRLYPRHTPLPHWGPLYSVAQIHPLTRPSPATTHPAIHRVREQNYNMGVTPKERQHVKCVPPALPPLVPPPPPPAPINASRHPRREAHGIYPVREQLPQTGAERGGGGKGKDNNRSI